MKLNFSLFCTLCTTALLMMMPCVCSAEVSLPATTDLIPTFADDQESLDGQLRIQSTSSAPDGGRFRFQLDSSEPTTLARYQAEFKVYDGGVNGKGQTELGTITFEPDSNNPETRLVATLVVGEENSNETLIRSQLDNLYTVTLWSSTAQLGLVALVNEALNPIETTSPFSVHYCFAEHGKGVVQAVLHSDPHPGNTRLVIQSQNLAPGPYTVLSNPNANPLSLGTFQSVRYRGKRANYDRKFYGKKNITEEAFLDQLHTISLNALREKATSSKKTRKTRKVGAFMAENTPFAISQLDLNPASKKRKRRPVASLLAETGRSVELALQNRRGTIIPLNCSENSGSQVIRFETFSGEHSGKQFNGYISITSLPGGKPVFDSAPLLLEARVTGISDSRLAFFPTNGETGSAYPFQELEDMTGDSQSVWEFQVTNVPSMYERGTGVEGAEHSLLLPMTVFLITKGGKSIRLFDINS